MSDEPRTPTGDEPEQAPRDYEPPAAEDVSAYDPAMTAQSAISEG